MTFPSAGKALRAVAAFVGNFLTAAISTNIFSYELSHILRRGTFQEMLVTEFLVSAVLASALGYFVYYKRHLTSAKWIWTAGVTWFIERTVVYWQQSQLSVLAGPNLLTVILSSFQPPYIPSVTPFALVLIRSIFYSAGAWYCSNRMTRSSAPAIS